MTIEFSFDGTTIDGVEDYGEEVSHKVDAIPILGRDGTKSHVALAGGRTINLAGKVVGTSEENMRANWEALAKIFYDDDGGLVKAYLSTFTNRRILCQLTRPTIHFGRNTQNMHVGLYALEFYADVPFWESTSAENVEDGTMKTGDTITCVEADLGNAPSWPIIVIDATTQLNSDIVLTNTTTGAVWTYEANLAALDTLTIDMEAHTVLDGVTNVINNVSHPAADWFALRGGTDNVIQIDFAGGAVDAGVAIDWRPRYFTFGP